VITNGLGYDDFMDKLLSASPSNHRQVLSVAKILDVTGQDANPHLWYNTPEVPKVAAQLEAALVAKDPADKAMFETNLQKFDASIQPILDTIADIKAKYAGVPVAYTERVPGYLLDNAGLDVATPPGFASAIEDGNDPSPADTLAMDNLMTNRGVRVLLYNAQTTSPVTQHVRDLAKAAGISVIGVTETMPAGEKTYQSWQLDQVQALEKALSGK
jgi:zinc/manganese transport system substrate-binding protein